MPPFSLPPSVYLRPPSVVVLRASGLGGLHLKPRAGEKLRAVALRRTLRMWLRVAYYFEVAIQPRFNPQRHLIERRARFRQNCDKCNIQTAICSAAYYVQLTKLNALVLNQPRSPLFPCQNTAVREQAIRIEPAAMSSNLVLTNPDIVATLAEFADRNQFLFFAPVCKIWRVSWGQRPTFTCYATPHTSLSQLLYSFECGLPRDRVGVCAAVASVGNPEFLQLARQQGCAWDRKTCARAAAGGYLDVLKWARENGCPWNEGTCSGAARRGHLHVLRWARANGCRWDENTCGGAASAGHLSILQWARDRSFRKDDRTYLAGAKGWRRAVRQLYVDDHDCSWSTLTCWEAAKSGYLDVLQWARDNGCPWNADTCMGAAEGGHLEVLRWARSNGCPWNERTCSGAAQGGNLGILQWARRNGCPWDEYTFTCAATERHLDVLDWARANGCPFPRDETFFSV